MTYHRTHSNVTSSGQCRRFSTRAMPGASVFRGVCVFFTGRPKHICQPRILPLRLSATAPQRQSRIEPALFLLGPRHEFGHWNRATGFVDRYEHHETLSRKATFLRPVVGRLYRHVNMNTVRPVVMVRARGSTRSRTRTGRRNCMLPTLTVTQRLPDRVAPQRSRFRRSAASASRRELCHPS